MITILLQATTVSLLFLSPVFSMDPPEKPTNPSTPASKRTSNKLVRRFSEYSLLEDNKSAPKDVPTTKIKRCEEKINYHKCKVKSFRAEKCLWQAEIEKRKYLELTEKSKKLNFEKIDDGKCSPEVVAALEGWKRHLKEAEELYKKVIALGNVKAQYDLGLVLRELSTIDPDYARPEIQKHIGELNKNAIDVGSDRAATVHFILGDISESDESKNSRKPRNPRKKSMSVLK